MGKTHHRLRSAWYPHGTTISLEGRIGLGKRRRTAGTSHDACQRPTRTRQKDEDTTLGLEVFFLVKVGPTAQTGDKWVPVASLRDISWQERSKDNPTAMTHGVNSVPFARLFAPPRTG
jgi:hypothetical protein